MHLAAQTGQTSLVKKMLARNAYNQAKSVWHNVIYTIVENEKKWGAPGTANVAILESRTTSSALRFPLEVSERSGDDR